MAVQVYEALLAPTDRLVPAIDDTQIENFVGLSAFTLMDCTPRRELHLDELPRLLGITATLAENAPLKKREEKYGIFWRILAKSSRLRARRDLGLPFEDLGQQHATLPKGKQDLLDATTDHYMLQLQEYLLFMHRIATFPSASLSPIDSSV